MQCSATRNADSSCGLRRLDRVARRGAAPGTHPKLRRASITASSANRRSCIAAQTVIPGNAGSCFAFYYEERVLRGARVMWKFAISIGAAGLLLCTALVDSGNGKGGGGGGGGHR